VLARTSSVVHKNALSDRALPAPNLPTTVKPCSKPDSCRLNISSASLQQLEPLLWLRAVCLLLPSVEQISLPKRSSAKFSRVISASPTRSDLSEMSGKLLNVRSPLNLRVSLSVMIRYAMTSLASRSLILGSNYAQVPLFLHTRLKGIRFFTLIAMIKQEAVWL